MRHKYKGRKLGTSYGHTKAMKVSLVQALFLNDRIKTTETRAKEIRSDVDRIITWAKRGDLHSRRLAISALNNNSDLVREIFEKVNQGMFKDRPGGYTRIMKLGPRKGDGARMVILELVTENCIPKAERKTAGKATASKKATPKQKAKKAAEEDVKEQEAADNADRENLGQRIHDSIEAAIEEESAAIREEGEAELAAEEAEAKKEDAEARAKDEAAGKEVEPEKESLKEAAGEALEKKEAAEAKKNAADEKEAAENAEAVEEVRKEEMEDEAKAAKNAEARDNAPNPADMPESEEHAK